MFSLKHKIYVFIALDLSLSSQLKLWSFEFHKIFKSNLNDMKLFTLPNLLTLINLFCGCLSVLFLTGQLDSKNIPVPEVTLILMGVSLLCDLLDGMVARMLNQNSEIGIQLDSLADMVSFGLVPGVMMFQLLDLSRTEGNFQFIYLSLFITLFSALRLAKFNVDTEQTSYFKGLATPANSIFIISLYWIFTERNYLLNKSFDQFILMGITVISCWLLIANIPMFSFKFKNMSWKNNYYKYIFLIISIVLLVVFQMNTVPFIILLYIIISILFRKKITHA